MFDLDTYMIWKVFLLFVFFSDGLISIVQFQMAYFKNNKKSILD